MQWGVAAVGGIIASAGIAAFVHPATHLKFGRELAVGRRLYGALVGRFIFGILLVAGAGGTRWPIEIEVLGWLFMIAAIGARACGLPRLRLIVIWWTDRPPSLARMWGVVAVCFGAIVLFAAI